MATHWNRMLSAGLAALTAALCAASAGAHHGTTEFDRGHPVVVNGVVREFRWTSPHAWLFLDVQAAGAAAAPLKDTGAAERRQWAFEGASITVMVRNGWKSSSLRAGDHVSVVAAPRRDGSRVGEFLSVTLTDSGKVLRLAGS